MLNNDLHSVIVKALRQREIENEHSVVKNFDEDVQDEVYNTVAQAIVNGVAYFGLLLEIPETRALLKEYFQKVLKDD